MNLLIGAMTIGFILSLLALGVYVSFRVFGIADITTDGSITLGAAVSAAMMSAGWNPAVATLSGMVAGMAAGWLSGFLHTKFKINALLSGILVMTALYSINLHVMGRSNIPLLSVRTLGSQIEALGVWAFGGNEVLVAGWTIASRDLAFLAFSMLLAVACGAALFFLFRTDFGTAMRATGDNAQMVRALGVNTGFMTVVGLALSNGIVAFSGAILAQYQGFADVQMGIGMIVWGLASVIIGEALVRSRSLGLAIAGIIMGSVLFRLIVAIALRIGLNPNDLKLVTAVFVLCALIVPDLLRAARKPKRVMPC